MFRDAAAGANLPIVNGRRAPILQTNHHESRRHRGFPAAGCVTASANATAIAASTALPPRFMTSTPTRERHFICRSDHPVARADRFARSGRDGKLSAMRAG